eukprot:1160368-Pelagomonas_calceolata.AAC.6
MPAYMLGSRCKPLRASMRPEAKRPCQLQSQTTFCVSQKTPYGQQSHGTTPVKKKSQQMHTLQLTCTYRQGCALLPPQSPDLTVTRCIYLVWGCDSLARAVKAAHCCLLTALTSQP